MTWLYVVVVGAAVARWSLWRIRDVIEWLEASHGKDQAPPAMLARLRLQSHGAQRMARMPALHFSEEVPGGPRGA